MTLYVLDTDHLSLYERNHPSVSKRKAGIRVGTQDLRIAAITLACSGILCTRNYRDFAQIPGLIFEDWSI